MISIWDRQRSRFPLGFLFLLVLPGIYAQETLGNIGINGPFHNQLYFNRNLINPTFSLVREYKSYLNVLHRSRNATFEDHEEDYYLGYSHLYERSAIGLGIYGNWGGVIQEIGINGNFAYGVPLGNNSQLAFGANITFSNQGIDRSRTITQEEDPLIDTAKRETALGIQPGLVYSVERFDFGVYAMDLFRYNQSSNQLVSNFDLKSLRGLIQYSQPFTATTGLFAEGRLLPMFQIGQDPNGQWIYNGSMLLDLPKYGWFQSAYDSYNGLSLGLGFNFHRTLSLGYLMEKNVAGKETDLGLNHEFSLAYTFNESNAAMRYAVNPKKRIEDEKVAEVVRNYEEQIIELRKSFAGHEEMPNDLAMENRMLIDEIIMRQDSIEEAHIKMFEARFELMLRVLRHELEQYRSKEIAANEAKSSKATAGGGDPVLNDGGPVAIKLKDQTDLDGVESGYYIIANVFQNRKYVDAFIISMNRQGLDARQFYNRKNRLYYVYLADFPNQSDAQEAMVSNLNGRYPQEKWIMRVYRPITTAQIQFED